jgi:hypothetical protein
MVKVVEKPLDRLDPMFSEAPARYTPCPSFKPLMSSDGAGGGDGDNENPTEQSQPSRKEPASDGKR